MLSPKYWNDVAAAADQIEAIINQGHLSMEVFGGCPVFNIA